MIVRTVLGDVDPADLGVTMPHEHLVIDSPLVVDRWPHIHLPLVSEAVAEYAPCVDVGLGAVVDAMPAASGRRVLRLAEVSRRCGLHVLSVTGLHTPKYYEGRPWASEESPEGLADLFVADVVEGIDKYDYTGPVVRRTEHRSGVVKVAWAGEEPTDRDRRVFEAAAITHARTGAPILTHCEEGKGGVAQVEALIALGVPADSICLSHVDKVDDDGYHRELLGAGVFLEYDQALRQGAEAMARTGRLAVEMVADGHGDRLMLSTDGARRSLWAVHGGLGIAWLLTDFVPKLRVEVGDAAVTAMLIENPARWLAFDPAGPARTDPPSASVGS